MKIRLNKFLSSEGITSRRKADELISSGRVDVNKKVVTELGFRVDPDFDIVVVDGEQVKVQKRVYYLLHKPKGFVTTTDDEKGRKTVMHLIENSKGLFPVGRLDINTTGALIITNDGDFANTVLHPSFGKKRVYVAKLTRSISEENQKRLSRGIVIDGRRSKFIEFTSLSKDNDYVRVSTLEGRNHFVKKMFEAIGIFVKDLHRESFAGLTLNDMPVGAYRVITETELSKMLG